MLAEYLAGDLVLAAEHMDAAANHRGTEARSRRRQAGAGSPAVALGIVDLVIGPVDPAVPAAGDDMDAPVDGGGGKMFAERRQRGRQDLPTAGAGIKGIEALRI